MPKLDDIKAFLEALGTYSFDDHWHGYYAKFDGVYGESYFEGDKQEVMLDCLEHYLCTSLGKYWHTVWYSTSIRHVLDIEIVKKLEIAISYYEALSDES